MTCPETGCVRDGDHDLHRDEDGELWIVGSPTDLPPIDPEQPW